MNPTRYFISDAHFGSGFGDDKARYDLLNSFADTIAGTNAELFILGDFFDFWIQYKTVIRSEYTPVIAALYSISRSGIPITFVRGNHDFMSHSFFTEFLGATVLDGHVSLNCNGIKLHLCHGDDLAGKWKYKVVNAILNNRFSQLFYKHLHPDFGITFATSFSRLSRNHSNKSGRYLSDDRHEQYKARVDSVLKESGDELLIMGHTHRAGIDLLEHGTYANCGSWLNSPTVLILKEKKLLLTEFTPEKKEPFKTISKKEF